MADDKKDTNQPKPAVQQQSKTVDQVTKQDQQSKSPPGRSNPPADAPWKPATVPVKNTGPTRGIIPPGSDGDVQQKVQDSVNDLIALIPPDASPELREAAERAKQSVSAVTGHAHIADANYDGRGANVPPPNQTGAK